MPDVQGMSVPEAAQAYGSAGLYVLPVRRGTKHPGSVLGKGWHLKSSRDRETITRWFAGTSHGIALHVGRSGLVVFDVDRPELMPDLLREAIAQCRPPFQQTRVGQPGKGHFVFRQPAGVVLGNGYGTLSKDWGEVRGKNGVIVVAPTPHPNADDGGLYRWVEVGPVPDLPDQLHRALQGPKGATRRTTLADAEAGRAIPGLLERAHLVPAAPGGLRPWAWTRAPCAAMQARLDLALKDLANGSRHEAILGNLVQMVRLARAAHSGLPVALDALREEFVERVADDRGGVRIAEAEWQRALEGALGEVLGEDGVLPPRDAACDCFLAQLRVAADRPELFSRGTAGLTERRVLTYLVSAARLRRSRVVAESQRQIAEAVHSTQPTVSEALRRLGRLGWIDRLGAGSRVTATRVRLLEPPVCDDVSTELPRLQESSPAAGSSADMSLHGRSHHLFSSAGLGPGPAETLAGLPELRIGRSRRAADGRTYALHRVVPGSRSTEALVHPWRTPRPIPRAARGRGPTARDLAQRTGKHRTTVLRHLQKLEDWGLVVRVPQLPGEDRWWRLRFDPDQIAEREGLVDPLPAKVERHRRQRRKHLQHLAAREGSQVAEEATESGVIYVDERTGEVIEEFVGLGLDQTKWGTSEEVVRDEVDAWSSGDPGGNGLKAPASGDRLPERPRPARADPSLWKRRRSAGSAGGAGTPASPGRSEHPVETPSADRGGPTSSRCEGTARTQTVLHPSSTNEKETSR